MVPNEQRTKASRVASTMLTQVGQDVLDRFQRRILRKCPVKPWMKHREVEIIQELLQRFQPRRVLEWGAGYGTVFFTEGIPALERWVSVEHNREWAEEIGDLNKDVRVEIIHVPANDPVLTDRFRDGTYHSFKDYIEFPVQFKPFDLILVDGRARTECMKKGRNFLGRDGILILHDANRRFYRPFSKDYADHCLFQDHRTLDGGLWIASTDRSIKDLLDYPRHRRVWEVYEECGKWLGPDF